MIIEQCLSSFVRRQLVRRSILGLAAAAGLVACGQDAPPAGVGSDAS
jgi:hypothetical protein